MKKLALAAALPAVLALGLPAHANQVTPTQTLSFGIQGSSTNVSVGGTAVSRSLSFKTFGQEIIDQGIVTPAGYELVLDSVHYVLDVQLDTDGQLSNVTSDAAAFALGTLNVSLINNWQTQYWGADGTPGPSSTEIWAASGGDLILIDSGGYNIAPNGGTWGPLSETVDPAAVPVDYINLGLTSGNWFDTGTFDVITTLQASTTLAGELESGTGTYQVTFATGTWGEVSLHYDYTFRPTVPVPAPLALMGLGLGLMGLRRFLRK